MKKFLPSFLIFIFVFQLFSQISFAATNSTHSNEIIGIINGIEIKKSDVNENGRIDNSIFESNATKQPYASSTYAAQTQKVATVKKGTNALLIKTLGAPRYNQQTDTYFLNPRDAREFALTLTSNTDLKIVGQTILGLVIGKVTTGAAGLLWTFSEMFLNLRLNSIKDDIINLAKDGHSVEVRIIKSSTGGTYYYVGKWDGTTISTTLANTSVSTEKIKFYGSKPPENVIVGSSSPYPGYAVKYGSTGATVTKVQQRLNSLGFSISADGSFGPATNTAVKNFQRTRSISVDGSVGPTTWNYLFNKTFKPSYPNTAVHYGSTGTIVLMVQARLNQLGYNLGAPDGSFGPATKNAVLKFQKSKGLSQDGYCGPATWSKLFG